MRSLLLVLVSVLAWSAPSDIAVEQQIREKLSKSKISTNQFTVKVKNGIATLEGTTAVIQHKRVATRLAKSGGAKQVDNRIQVSEEAKRKARERLAEGRKTAAGRKLAAKTSSPAPAKSAAVLPVTPTALKSTTAAPLAPPPLRRAQVVQR